jgi:hypothetical protein
MGQYIMGQYLGNCGTIYYGAISGRYGTIYIMGQYLGDYDTI